MNIPKDGQPGKFRPLGIPCIKDRVVQMAAVLVLEPIFEADLQPEQHAYRPEHSALDAVRQVEALLRAGHTDVIDADLSGYFDSIPHAELMKSAARRISDSRMLRLLKMWLEAPVEEIDARGRHHRTTRNKDEGRGTPQGSPITPPTMLQTTLLGAPFKRGRTDAIHDADLLLVDLDLLHQGPDDLSSRVPVGLLQLLGDASGELLQLADHQPQFRFLGGLAHLLLTLGLQLGQAPCAARSLGSNSDLSSSPSP